MPDQQLIMCLCGTKIQSSVIVDIYLIQLLSLRLTYTYIGSKMFEVVLILSTFQAHSFILKTSETLPDDVYHPPNIPNEVV